MQGFKFKDGVKKLVDQCKGNKSEAARRLVVERTMIHRYLRETGAVRARADVVERLDELLSA